jgi:hypothetical protein
MLTLLATPIQAGAQVPPEAVDDGLTPEERQLLAESLSADTDMSESSAPAPSGTATANPDIAFILDVAAAVFSGEKPLQLGAHDAAATGFHLQQLEMSARANVDPFLRFDANLVFSEFGVEVEEAYATTLALPANLQLRAGQFLTKMGRVNPTHPHAWQFADQPLVNGKFLGGEGSRGLGMELSLLVPLPWYVQLVGSANQAGGECCARSFYGGEDLGVNGPEDLLYTARLEQFFDLGTDWSLLLGNSAQFGPNPTGQENRTEIYAADLYLRFRPVDSVHRMAVSLQLEGMVRQRQLPGRLLRDWGGYGQLVWTLRPEWETGARHEWVTGVDEDPLDPDWDGVRQRSSTQVTWYPSHFSRLRLQGTYTAHDGGFAGILTLELLVGAHGAHAY